MFIEQPPEGEFSPLARAWFNRVFAIIDTEITNSNAVIVVKTLPDRPREGRIYFIKTDGYYVWLNSIWYKLDKTEVI